MALFKEKVNPKTGAVSTYHKIAYASVLDDILQCEVASYASKEFREHGKSLEKIIFDFNITVEEEESMGIRQLAYKKLKELPEWEDAEDC